MNLGSEEGFIFEGLNVTADFRGNTFITNWSKPDPTMRPNRMGLGPCGNPMHVEPFFSNPFGPKINKASTQIISHAASTF